MSVEGMLKQIYVKYSKEAQRLGKQWCGLSSHPFTVDGNCPECQHQEELRLQFWKLFTNA